MSSGETAENSINLAPLAAVPSCLDSPTGSLIIPELEIRARARWFVPYV